MKSIRRGLSVCLFGVALALLSGWPVAGAAQNDGFVVLPEDAPRFAGPAGIEPFMESLMAQVLATLTGEISGKDGQPGGSFGIWRYVVPPGGGPAARTHPGADEFFYVLSGVFDFEIGARVLRATPGSLVFIPRDALHAFKNVGAGPGALVGGVMPAGFERHLAEWKARD